MSALGERVPSAAEANAMTALAAFGSDGLRAAFDSCERAGWVTFSLAKGFEFTERGRAALATYRAGEKTIAERAVAWWGSRDTGVSSQAIARYMQGLPRDCTRAPIDVYDFGRCVRLLDRIPEWHERLPEMAAYGAAWAEIVAAWDVLLPIYRECAKHVGHADWDGCREHYDAWKAALAAYRAQKGETADA